MIFLLPRKRVIEELKKYEKESTRLSKREFERLTKFPGKSEFRERKVGKWVTQQEYRKGIEHADTLHKLPHSEAYRLEKRWKTWYRRRRRPLSGFDKYGRWIQRRDLFSSFLNSKNRGNDIDERDLDPQSPLASEFRREQPRYTIPQDTQGALNSTKDKPIVKGAPSSMPMSSSVKPPTPSFRSPDQGEGDTGQLFENVSPNIQESEFSEGDSLPQEKLRRSFRDVIFSRREERGSKRKPQKHGKNRIEALQAEQKSRRDADFTKNERGQNAVEKQGSATSLPEILTQHDARKILQPSEELKTLVKEGSSEGSPVYERPDVPVSSEGFYGKGKAFQELLVSGVTLKTEEEKERDEENFRKAKQKHEEDARHFVARVVWFLFIVLFIILWVLEIAMFSIWWGWLGTFVGFVLGPFLIVFFPFLALLQQESGVAIFSLGLFVLAGTCLVYAWPEALQFVRHFRR